MTCNDPNCDSCNPRCDDCGFHNCLCDPEYDSQLVWRLGQAKKDRNEQIRKGVAGDFALLERMHKSVALAEAVLQEREVSNG